VTEGSPKLRATASNRMTPVEIEAFARGRRNGALATYRSDGLIQLTPVWYWYDDGRIIFALGEHRRHQRNLRQTPTATILIEQDLRLTQGWRAGARGVMFAGPVTPVEDPALIAAYDEKMAAHYLGEEANDPDFLASVEAEAFHTWMMTPRRVLSWDFTKETSREA
jgi:hypothetical protein